ncbi:MAG: hypothetical protein A2Z34_04610 [Planctomycetes bacterium RBG_16_59_8]|nr:MAG: hypothetical protein A2Z34_04610 [Planctomycetes bacterium RBG_16_59_8]
MSNGTDNTIFQLANTSGTPGTFAEQEVYAETEGTSWIYSPRVITRGTDAHIVFCLQYDEWDGLAGNDELYYYHTTDSSGWTLNELEFTGDFNDTYDLLDFAADSAGNFHVAYYSNGDYINYRQLDSDETVWTAEEQVSAVAAIGSLYDWDEAPFILFDGTDNVYAFWEQSDLLDGDDAIYFNIKEASIDGLTAFAEGNATIVTDELNDDGWYTTPWSLIGDIQVASDGSVHALWKNGLPYGTESQYPLWYRTKAAGDLDPSNGWGTEEIVIWMDGNSSTGGMENDALLRVASNGDLHAFWSDYPSDMLHIHHAIKESGSAVWQEKGTVDGPTSMTYYTDDYADFYILDVGVESDGKPYCLMVADSLNDTSKVFYTNFHVETNQWVRGVRVSGANTADWSGDFWVGLNGSDQLHLLWQAESDPFDNSGYYDVFHSNRE